MILACNRVIQHSLEQGVLLVCGVIALDRHPKLGKIIDQHLIGRGLFAVGYILGEVLWAPPLRTPGLVLILGAAGQLLYYMLYP
jgi:hypothetical protein